MRLLRVVLQVFGNSAKRESSIPGAENHPESSMQYADSGLVETTQRANSPSYGTADSADAPCQSALHQGAAKTDSLQDSHTERGEYQQTLRWIGETYADRNIPSAHPPDSVLICRAVNHCTEN